MSERKLEEWDAEKRQQENYYKVDTKTKWTVFACYIGLMAILGYAAYEGYIVFTRTFANEKCIKEYCRNDRKNLYRNYISTRECLQV